jgi:hypothetical protein
MNLPKDKENFLHKYYITIAISLSSRDTEILNITLQYHNSFCTTQHGPYSPSRFPVDEFGSLKSELLIIFIGSN